MSPEDSSLLSYYLDRNDWDGVVTAALSILERDPQCIDTHRQIAYAYAALDKNKEADHHLDRLLSLSPSSEETLLAAVYIRFKQRRTKQCKTFVDQALSFYPDSARFYYYDAILSTKKLKIPHAKQQIAKAKELDPEDTDISDIYLRIHSIDESSAKDSVARVEEYKAALHREPENAALHHGIGDIYMDDLHQPAEAEKHFREAVRLKPDESSYRKELFHAVALQSIIYGVLSLPSRAVTFMRNLGRAILIQPWRLIFLLFAFKIIGVFLVWLILASILFWPLAKIYEHIIVSEIKDADKVSNSKLRSWYYFQSKPAWFRFSIFGFLSTSAYSAIFYLSSIPQVDGFIGISIFVVAHLAILAIIRLGRTIRYKSAKKQSG